MANSAQEQIEKHIRRTQRLLAEAEQERQELLAFKAEVESDKRRESLGDVFEGLGLQRKWAELYAASRPGEEPTYEGIAEFCAQSGLPEPRLQEL